MKRIQKKIRQINVTAGRRTLSVIIENEKVYISDSGEIPKYMNTISDLLYCLVQNLNHPVDRAALLKYVPKDIESKTFLNYFDTLKKIFKPYGPDLIQTGGQKSTYWAMFRASESCEILFSDENCAAAPDYYEHLERTEGMFPSAAGLTGGRAIRSELLPLCLCGGKKYPSLSSFVLSSFLGTSLQNSLILTGEGGSGKTFSLFDTYRSTEAAGFRPIYIHAGDLDGEEFNLFRHVAAQHLHVRDHYLQRGAFEEFVENSSAPILLLIDGLNEVPDIKKITRCCESFGCLTHKFPGRCFAIFASRYPQILRAKLYHPQEASLLPLPAVRFQDSSLELLSRLHLELTPLLKVLLEDLPAQEHAEIRSRYDLYSRYFDVLTQQADRKDRSGWIYDVLAFLAAEAAKGQTIDSRWLKKFCSPDGPDDFIHKYCAGEEFPLEEPSAAEKLKGTGFLLRSHLDQFEMHQQYRDFLAVRCGLLMISRQVLPPAEFLSKLIDATRYYRIAEEEDPGAIQARRHNNADLGEFGFYAGLQYFRLHPEEHTLAPLLVQLGIQVSYLYDNLERWWPLFLLYREMEPLLLQCLRQNTLSRAAKSALPGYYYCLNRLALKSKETTDLAQAADWLSFSKKIEALYQEYLQKCPAADKELQATVFSGIGGVYLERQHLVTSFEEKKHCMDSALQYHTRAMTLRRETGSPKLFRSYTALGTCSYYKSQLYASASGSSSAVLRMLEEAVHYHMLAVGQDANQEKYISWPRIAGCFYQMYQHTDAEDRAKREEYCSELFRAVVSGYKALRASAASSGISRHSSIIRSFLLDVSKYMPLLSPSDAASPYIDELCSLYHQAFQNQKKPVCSADRQTIEF